MNTLPAVSGPPPLIATVAARIQGLWARFFPAASNLRGETGGRLSSDEALRRLYATMWVDYERRAVIQLMRQMDQQDGRVKQIHGKLARDCIRGGLVMQVNTPASSETLTREWKGVMGRLQLDRMEKLKSDARGMVVEGNLALQLVYAETMDLAAAIRMPSDTIVPIVDMGGRFKDPANAYEQRDVLTMQTIGRWGAWQMAMTRLDPDNFDDMGSMGRPFLDGCATKWRQLVMTEEDLVIRRRMRAPLRLAHVLPGADEAALAAYRKDIEANQGQITTDFYINRKDGGVTAVQGDAKLNDILDVIHLLDTFYAGGPAPKGMFGYNEKIPRDVLEDIKRDYYDEVDCLQDTVASAYEMAFRMHLLFKGIDPAPGEFTLRFAQRRTDTPNQVADLALKYIAAGLPDDIVYSEMGFDPDYVRQKRIEQAQRNDPYPPIGGTPAAAGPAKVSITPGNARKGESGTTIANAGGNGGRGRA